MACVVLFFVRQCIRTGKFIYRRCTQKYGKDIDISIVGPEKTRGQSKNDGLSKKRPKSVETPLTQIRVAATK